MKLPLTDKFLWDLYNLFEELSRTFDLGIPSSPRDGIDLKSIKMKREWQRMRRKRKFSRLIYYLKKKGLIKIENLEDKKAVLLTPKGLEKALKIKFKMIKKKKRRDGKWLMVIFDIPEKKRYLRDLLREHLNFLGYKMLQRSIWICPFDVAKETKEFLRRYSLDPYVRIFLIEKL